MSRTVQQTFGPLELEKVQGASRTIPKLVQDWLALFDLARGKAGMSQKSAASDMGITAQQLSTQMSGREGEHVSFTRMRNLPPEFWRELILLIADFHHITIGGTQQDAEDVKLGRLVREVVTRCR